MTMPALITNHQKKQTVTQLKKVYSELSQAVAMAKLEYGDMSNWDYSLSGTNFFNKYLTDFIKISEITVADAKSSGITYYNLLGNVEKNFTSIWDTSRIITLPSGTQIYTSLYTNNRKNYMSFLVDLNGFKKPNKFGRDLFLFTVTTEGVVAYMFEDNEFDWKNVERDRDDLLNGSSSNQYCCNIKNDRGMWCAAVIIMDGWEIKDDYPW